MEERAEFRYTEGNNGNFACTILLAVCVADNNVVSSSCLGDTGRHGEISRSHPHNMCHHPRGMLAYDIPQKDLGISSYYIYIVYIIYSFILDSFRTGITLILVVRFVALIHLLYEEVES